MMRTKDETLAARCRGVGQSVREAVGWLEANAASLHTDTGGLAKELKRAGLAAAKLERAAGRKMCVGVFGPSQSGKSYLISALARRGTDPLMADFAGTEVDFIAEINPEGGKESTGVVTRFTVDKTAGLAAEHPIELRLLSEPDVLKILVNAYANDVAHDQEDEAGHDPKAILAAVEALAGRAGPAPTGAIGEDDVADLEEYCNERLIGAPRIKVLRRIGFWDRALALAPRLAPADRAALFAVVWDGIEAFTAVYRRLQDALAAVGHAGTVACGLEGLFRSDGGVHRRREDSIINVETLSGLGQGGGDPVSVAVPGKGTAKIARPELTALIAELRIVMRDKPFGFFDHTDLLDFPGARSRKAHPNDADHLMRSPIREELFLRGKVAYLFERYCAEQELTSMLLCMGPENMEVVSLPGLVFEWIRTAQGELPQDRDGRQNALFVVLTKFDTAFAQAAGKGTGASRWSTRLQTSLLKPFGGHPGWPLTWTPTKAFDNCYWIRNPNFRQDQIFDYTAATSLVETTVRADKTDFVAELRASFLDNEDARRHFADPAEAWDAAMRLNDGGIGLIARRLEPLCNPDLKHDQVASRLRRLAEGVVNRLRPFHFSGDLDTERRKKQAMIERVVTRLARCASRQLFGELLRSFHLDENDVYDIYLAAESPVHDGDDAAEAAPVPAAVIGSAVDTDDLMSELFGRPKGSGAPSASGPDTAPRDRPEHFAREVESFWTERLGQLGDSPHWLRYFGIEGEDVADLAQELMTAARRDELWRRIAQEVRLAAQFKDADKGALIWRQVIPVVTQVNDFVDWLGHGGPARREGTEVTLDGKTRRLFVPRPPVGAFPAIGAEAAAYDRGFYVDWLLALRHLVDDNVAYQAGANVNVAENARLGAVLDKLQLD